MQSHIRFTAGLMVVGLVGFLAAQENQPKARQFSAEEIIGKKVMNAQNEDLGKVQDLIVNFDHGTVPYAVISSGLVSRNKIAVPLESLQCSSDGKHFVLAATKEELTAASKSPQGRWAIAENAAWTKTIDGYHGQPAPGRERFMRQPLGEGDARLYARDPTVKGAEQLMQPADRALCEKICEAIETVQVDVQNGVARLSGTVDNDAERQNIETKVRAVRGVQRVENHLKVKNQ